MQKSIAESFARMEMPSCNETRGMPGTVAFILRPGIGRAVIGKLKEVGFNVEWQSKLTGFTEEDSGVRATISHNNGTEDVHVVRLVFRRADGSRAGDQGPRVCLANRPERQRLLIGDLRNS